MFASFFASALYPPALLAFSLLWFYFPTKFMYPRLGVVWEVFVAMPVMAAAISGVALGIQSPNTYTQLCAAGYVLFVLWFWHGKVKARVQPTTH